MTSVKVIGMWSLVAVLAIACAKEETPEPKKEMPVPSAKTVTPPPQPPPKEVERPDSPVTQPALTTLDKVTWMPGPDGLPKGVMIAVIEGTPPFDTAKTYSLLAKMPKNYTIPAHTHPATERVTVLKGTFNFGMGDKLDKKTSVALTAGGIAIIPAGHTHGVWTKDETIVQVQGVGPFAIYYVDPKDDPRPTPVAKPATMPSNGFDSDQQAIHINAKEVKFGPAPEGLLPPGAELAVLEGTPPFDQAKSFLVRIKMPKGYKVPSHTHGIPDRGTVVSGALKVGLGHDWDDKAMTDLPAGSLFSLPVGASHYVAASDDSVLQVFGVGPFDIKWVNEKDNPAAGMAPAGTMGTDKAAPGTMGTKPPPVN